MYAFIFILKAIATILITNSHLGKIYPISWLSTGGALGNSLFFLISGFLLYKPKTDFKTWYKKKLIRLYMPLVLSNCYLLINSKNVFETLLFDFVFPQKYWFICALLIMYPILYYITTHKFETKQFIAYSLVLAVIYVCIYVFLDKTDYVVETKGLYGIRFSYIFSFFLMLLGAYFRKNMKVLIYKVKGKKMIPYFIVSLILYYMFLKLMFKFEVLMKFQFLETILCIATVVTLFFIFLGFENQISKYKDKFLFKVFEFLGALTLEIYIVQFRLIDFIGDLGLVFPVNFIAVVGAIILSAFILSKISNKISILLLEKTKEKGLIKKWWQR